MPLIGYLCENNHSTKKFFRNPKEAPITLECNQCKKVSKKQLFGPNSKSIVIVDNGLQSKAIEVDLEMVEDIKERSTKDFKDK